MKELFQPSYPTFVYFSLKYSDFTGMCLGQGQYYELYNILFQYMISILFFDPRKFSCSF